MWNHREKRFKRKNQKFHICIHPAYRRGCTEYLLYKKLRHTTSLLGWNSKKYKKITLRKISISTSKPFFFSMCKTIPKSPQCRSRDLQTATVARCFVTICIHDAGFTFIRAYGMNMTCMPLNTEASIECQRPTSLLKSKTQTIISPKIKISRIA